MRSMPAHACPQFVKTPQSAPSTARSRSASSRTSIASFPPSSSTAGQSRSAAAWATFLPTSAEPVKTTAVDAAMSDERLAHVASPLHDADEAGGRAGAAEDLLDPRAGKGRELGRLHDRRVPRRDRRRRLAQRDREREVPGRDDPDDAEGLVADRPALLAEHELRKAGGAPRAGRARGCRRASGTRRPTTTSSWAYASASGFPDSARRSCEAIASASSTRAWTTRSSSRLRASNGSRANAAWAIRASATTSASSSGGVTGTRPSGSSVAGSTETSSRLSDVGADAHERIVAPGAREASRAGRARAARARPRHRGRACGRVS